MGRIYRPVIGVWKDAQHTIKREWQSAYVCAKEIGTDTQNVMQALNRNGNCCGWKLYDSPEYLRERITEIERQIKEVEEL